MSQERQERSEDRKRKTIYSGNAGISKDVWEEAMKLTRQSEQERRQQHQQPERQNQWPR